MEDRQNQHGVAGFDSIDYVIGAELELADVVLAILLIFNKAAPAQIYSLSLQKADPLLQAGLSASA